LIAGVTGNTACGIKDIPAMLKQILGGQRNTHAAEVTRQSKDGSKTFYSKQPGYLQLVHSYIPELQPIAILPSAQEYFEWSQEEVYFGFE
jgi:hypothetical protein